MTNGRARISFLLSLKLWIFLFVVIIFGRPLCYIAVGLIETTAVTTQIATDNGADHTVIDLVDPFPKYLHQIWFGYTGMPSAWNKTIRTSRNMNEQYTYKLWSATDVESLLEKYYPWFLTTYHSYPKTIQRVDAARYFILHQYGGMTLDMDIRTKIPISRIIQRHNVTKYDCMIPQAEPIGVTIDMMMCRKGSPFMAFVQSRLANFNRWYAVPYATVMFSTGPVFFSQSYHAYPDKESLYVLPALLYTRTYFSHVVGSTWHGWDALAVRALLRYVAFLGRHPVWLLVGICAAIVALYLIRLMARTDGKAGLCCRLIMNICRSPCRSRL